MIGLEGYLEFPPTLDGAGLTGSSDVRYSVVAVDIEEITEASLTSRLDYIHEVLSAMRRFV